MAYAKEPCSTREKETEMPMPMSLRRRDTERQGEGEGERRGALGSLLPSVVLLAFAPSVCCFFKFCRTRRPHRGILLVFRCVSLNLHLHLHLPCILA